MIRRSLLPFPPRLEIRHRFLAARGAGKMLPGPLQFAIHAVRTTVEHRRMHNSDYYREEAAKYRELAEMAKDAAMKQELLELAAACEAIADNIDDLGASG